MTSSRFGVGTQVRHRQGGSGTIVVADVILGALVRWSSGRRTWVEFKELELEEADNMTERTHRPGDVVAWERVPHGSLVRGQDGTFFWRDGAEWGRVVYHHSVGRWRRAGRWAWACPSLDMPDSVTIIALGLTGQSAAGLRRLAEVFEVRKSLHIEPGLPGLSRVYFGERMVGGFSGGDGLTYWAGRLYAAGVRAGDSAARVDELLLAEVEH